MKKKIFAILFVLTLGFTLIGCSDENEINNNEQEEIVYDDEDEETIDSEEYDEDYSIDDIYDEE